MPGGVGGAAGVTRSPYPDPAESIFRQIGIPSEHSVLSDGLYIGQYLYTVNY